MAIPYSISFDTERAVPTSDSEHANEAVGLPEGSEPFGLMRVSNEMHGAIQTMRMFRDHECVLKHGNHRECKQPISNVSDCASPRQRRNREWLIACTSGSGNRRCKVSILVSETMKVQIKRRRASCSA